MKLKAIALLILFTTFIVAPTVLSTLCKGVDISLAFSLVEEEEETHKTSVEEVSELFVEKHPISLFKDQRGSGKILVDFLLKHDNVFTKIFSPPPEQKLV